MRKITFIIILLGVIGLGAYFYNERQKVISYIQNIEEPEVEISFAGPDDGVDDIAAAFASKPQKENVSIVTVGSERVSCTGVAPMECMVVDGELFYDNIEGFEYEEGYVYSLEVEQIFKDEPVPADSASWYYELIDVISKTSPGDLLDISGTSWIWESYTDSPREVLMQPQKIGSFTLSFDAQGRVSGETDCNNYFGSYTSTGDSLVIGQLGSTLIACTESQEVLYHNLLSEIKTYRIEDNQLMLNGDDGISMAFVTKEN